MDIVIESIYKSCDQTNTNLVPVSSLIQFIKPYMSHHSDELDNLKRKLDPESNDRCIDFSLFQLIMSDWIASMRTDDINNSFSELTSSHQNFSPNISVITESNNPLNNNQSINQEHVERLTLQLNKATNELDLIKQQLAACEEQNELLLADINMRDKYDCIQQCNSDRSLNDYLNQNDQIYEEIVATNKKCKQLEKLLSNCEKDKQKYMAQVSQLECENIRLLEKLTLFERVKQEGRKSLSDMKDSLDIKETEISTLMEIIDSLKCELEEKSELLYFYTNENKLLKQKVADLEMLLKNSSFQNNTHTSIEDDSTKNLFNTPKFLNQIAHPVSPTLVSPVLETYHTSSPIKNYSFQISNDGNSNLSFNNSCRITMSSNSHKTLKEELAEIIDENHQSGNKITGPVEHLQKMLKQQEEIKNFLWQSMKQLHNENESLLNYKKQCIVNEQQLENLKTELLLRKNQNYLVMNLSKDLSNLELNLKHQKFMNLHLKDKLNFLKKSVLQNKLTVTKKKLMVHQSTETNIWNEPNKKTNYTKQQMKMEKLLEKQDRIEKDLNNEKKINFELTAKYQEQCKLNANIENELLLCHKRLLEQEEMIHKLETEKSKFVAELKSKMGSDPYLGQLQSDVNKLKNENQLLNENIRNALNRLESEVALNKKLYIDNEYLLNHICKLECEVKEKRAQLTNLQQRLNHIITINSFANKQLEDELVCKCMEIRTLKKQMEVIDLTGCIAGCNSYLKNLIEKFRHLFNLKPVLYNSYVPCGVEFFLDNQIVLLSTNIAILDLLLKHVEDKFQNEKKSDDTHNGSKNLLSIPNDDIFLPSFSSGVSRFDEDIPSLVFAECDEILENVYFEIIDFKNLSLEEREEKFASLALLLAVDVDVLNKRILNQKEKFTEAIAEFLSHLNSSLQFYSDTTKARYDEIVSSHLLSIQQISGNLLKFAVRYGALLYEKKTTVFWKLVINYVALLNEEKNNRAQKRKLENLTLHTSPVYSLSDGNQDSVASNSASTNIKEYSKSKLKFWYYTLFIVFFVLAALLLYVDYICPKNGNRTCPLQWITDLFIQKIYLPNSSYL